VLIAEFGVPTSRGIAHLQPEGQHHGGHDEVAQGEIDARLLRDIHQAGLAGGVVFAWIDEWFKRNWVVMNYESPRERNPLWLNALDAEQNFGLIAAQPGDARPAVVLDGRLDDWRSVEPVYERDPTTVPPGGVVRLRVTSDAAYLYLALETEPRSGKLRYLVGIDTYDPGRGSRRFPPPAARSTSIGMEFVLELAGDKDSRLRVERGYDLFSNRLRRPYASTANDAGDFIDIHVWTNRDRYGRDGTYYRAKGYDRSPLRLGTTDPDAAAFDSLADFDTDETTGAIEVRLPWGLLNVADPSSRRVIHETSATDGPVQTTRTEGFRFHLLAVRADDQSRVVDEWPPTGSGVDDHPIYAWPTWERPDWHLRPKRSLAILGETIRSLGSGSSSTNPENHD